MPSHELLALVARLAEAEGVDLGAWGLAWARVMPTVVLVPAFGLRAIPAPARVVLGLTLALCIAPAFVRPVAADTPWVVQLFASASFGLPVALGAASVLWAASQAGALADDLRGGRDTTNLPNLGATTPLGALLGMLASVAFLEGGGAARVVMALARTDGELLGAWTRASHALLGSVELAIAVAAPVIAAAIVLEVASALVARAASPAFVQPLLAPLKSLLVLGVFALVLERMVELIAVAR